MGHTKCAPAADQLFFDQSEEDLVRDRTLSQQAKTNSLDNFKYPVDDVIRDFLLKRVSKLRSPTN